MRRALLGTSASRRAVLLLTLVFVASTAVFAYLAWQIPWGNLECPGLRTSLDSDPVNCDHLFSASQAIALGIPAALVVTLMAGGILAASHLVRTHRASWRVVLAPPSMVFLALVALVVFLTQPMDTSFGPIWMLGAPAVSVAVVYVFGVRAGRERAWTGIAALGLLGALLAAAAVLYLIGIRDPMYPNTRMAIKGIAIATSIELVGLAVLGVVAYRARASRGAVVTALVLAVGWTCLVAWASWNNCVIPAACRIFD